MIQSLRREEREQSIPEDSSITGMVKASLKWMIPSQLHPAVPQPVLITKSFGKTTDLELRLRALYPRVLTLPAVNHLHPEAMAREAASSGWGQQNLNRKDYLEFAQLLSIQRALRLQVNDRIRLMILLEDHQLVAGDLRPEVRSAGRLFVLLPWLNSIRLTRPRLLLTTRSSASRILSKIGRHSAEAADKILRDALKPQIRI